MAGIISISGGATGLMRLLMLFPDVLFLALVAIMFVNVILRCGNKAEIMQCLLMLFLPMKTKLCL